MMDDGLGRVPLLFCSFFGRRRRQKHRETTFWVRLEEGESRDTRRGPRKGSKRESSISYKIQSDESVSQSIESKSICFSFASLSVLVRRRSTHPTHSLARAYGRGREADRQTRTETDAPYRYVVGAALLASLVRLTDDFGIWDSHPVFQLGNSRRR
jgi:hypothetical protein